MKKSETLLRESSSAGCGSKSCRKTAAEREAFFRRLSTPKRVFGVNKENGISFVFVVILFLFERLKDVASKLCFLIHFCSS